MQDNNHGDNGSTGKSALPGQLFFKLKTDPKNIGYLETKKSWISCHLHVPKCILLLSVASQPSENVKTRL